MTPMETPIVPTNQQVRRFTTFELSIAQLRAQLAEITGVDTMEVSRDDDEPTIVLLKFKRTEECGE